jgi:fructose-1,6-bisphosphatase/inositol monophosphatase family enzyme
LKPGIISPCILKLGSSAASVCMVVCGRISSSWASSSTPFWSLTGTIDFLK